MVARRRAVRVMLEEALLKAVDHAAERAGETRSAFANIAVRAEIKCRQNETLEAHDRVSYCETLDDDA